ncbi:MAG TPA: ATP-binding cassette domain-containing protein, partial [Thiotrichales bacterium]|nr:ATP-binding cassette domain-containing protein [Thiotrichales bacterium]
MNPILQLKQIRKSYNIGTSIETEILHGIDIELSAGSFSALTGPSGSGKSTLLNIIGLLEPPTSGELVI